MISLYIMTEDSITNMRYISVRNRDYALAVRKDYPLDKIWTKWQNALPDKRLKGTEKIGCGLNALAFMSEISITKAENIVEAGMPPIGTSIEDMVDWLNNKQQNLPTEKTLYFEKYTYQLIDPGSVDLNDLMMMGEIKHRILHAYNEIFSQMTNDSITIIKYERDPEELIRLGVVLAPGHSVILGRQNNNLYTADPQGLSPPRKIKLDGISDSAYNSLILEQHYRGFSVIRARHIDCAVLIDLILSNNIPDAVLAAQFLKNRRSDIYNSPGIFGGGGSMEKGIDITEYLKYMPPLFCNINSTTPSLARPSRRSVSLAHSSRRRKKSRETSK